MAKSIKLNHLSRWKKSGNALYKQLLIKPGQYIGNCKSTQTESRHKKKHIRLGTVSVETAWIFICGQLRFPGGFSASRKILRWLYGYFCQNSARRARLSATAWVSSFIGWNLTVVADGPKVSVSVRVNGAATSDGTAVEGSTVSLECSTAVANPPVIPAATWWLRNGLPVQDGRSPLLMRRLDRTQAGRYTCSATNTLAPSGEPPRNVTGTATVQLHVMCACLSLTY